MISGLLFLAKSQLTLDTLELSLVGGQVRIYLRLGHYEKEMTVGQSLNDDLWHTITFKRRGNIFEGYIDDEEPRKGMKLLSYMCFPFQFHLITQKKYVFRKIYDAFFPF